MFQHGWEVNLSSHVTDLSFACGPSRTSRQKIETSAGRKKIIKRQGGGRKVYAKQPWIHRTSVLQRAAAPKALVRPPQHSPPSPGHCRLGADSWGRMSVCLAETGKSLLCLVVLPTAGHCSVFMV